MPRKPGPVTDVGITILSKFSAHEAELIDSLIGAPGLVDRKSIEYRRAVTRLAGQYQHLGARAINNAIRQYEAAVPSIFAATSRSAFVRYVVVADLQRRGLLPELLSAVVKPTAPAKPKFRRTVLEFEGETLELKVSKRFRDALHGPVKPRQLLAKAIKSVEPAITKRLRASVDRALRSPTTRQPRSTK